jgi:hypothetical protein
VRWPLSLNFVQIDENGAMSNLLLDRFLPFRFKLMSNLPPSPPLPAPAPPLPAPAPLPPAPAAQTSALRQQLRSQLQAFRPTKDAVQSVQSLSNAIRKADKSQPGAFVRQRKPD